MQAAESEDHSTATDPAAWEVSSASRPGEALYGAATAPWLRPEVTSDEGMTRTDQRWCRPGALNLCLNKGNSREQGISQTFSYVIIDLNKGNSREQGISQTGCNLLEGIGAWTRWARARQPV